MESNFYEIGGNSLNTVFTVTKLRDQGYLIGITEFISCKTLMDVLNKMIPEDKFEGGKTNRSTSSQYHSEMLREFHCEMLRESQKEDLYRIILDSFCKKDDCNKDDGEQCEQCVLMPNVTRCDYTELLDKLWEPLLEKNLSFVICEENGQVVGVAMNYDAYDEPEMDINSKLSVVFEFLEYLEAPIRESKLPHGKGHVLHGFMMGTDLRLSYQQNVNVYHLMEEEVLKLARSRGFTGSFATNTSPLTQQLGTDIYEYEVLNDYQVNQYVAPDGSKPFCKAPDSQRAVCLWKLVKDSA